MLWQNVSIRQSTPLLIGIVAGTCFLFDWCKTQQEAGFIARMTVSVLLGDDIISILNIRAPSSVFNIWAHDSTILALQLDELLCIDAAVCDNVSPRFKTVLNTLIKLI